MKALNRLSDLRVDFVSLVNRAAVRDPSNPTEPMRFLLTKSEVPVVDMTAGGATTNQGGHMPDTEAELRAALEKSEQENKQLRKAAKKAAKKPKPTDANPDPDHDGDDDRTAAGDTDHDYHPAPKGGAKMSKSEREEIAKAEERIAKAEQRAKDAEKIAKQERDLRVRSEFVAKAETEFSLLGDPNELGPRLHRMSEQLSKEDFDAQLEQMAATQAQLQKADLLLMGQIGRDGSPTASSGTDTDKVRKAAAELRKSDSSLGEYEALVKAINENPDVILANR